MPSWSIKRLIVTVAILLLCGIGLFQILHPEVTKRWLANHYAAKAEALSKGGAHDAARLSAVKAVNLDPNCVRALEALLPEIPLSDFNDLLLIRERLADRNPSDLANLYNLALFGITFERYDVASRTIDKLERTSNSPLAVLELRARLAASQNDFTQAGQQAHLLLEKDPANPVGRLIWALAVLRDGPPANRKFAEGVLEGLLKVEPLKLEAQRGLRRSAMVNHELPRAKEWSESIIKNPAARFDDWLSHAEILVEEQPQRLPELLQELTNHAQTNPQALIATSLWLRKHGKEDQVSAWIDQCQALRSLPAVAQIIRADSLLAQRAWPQLSSMLIPLKWGDLEYYRWALLARALREQNELDSKAWDSAMGEAIKNPAASIRLADLVSSWTGWEEQLEGFLWRMERKQPSNTRWALSKLDELYQKQKNTSGLLRVSEELYRLYSSNELFQNNLVFYSLLLKTQLERAFSLIGPLYQSHPQAPEIASTYSLAMLRQKEFKKALEALEKLPPEVRSNTGIAPYYAAALAANGQTPAALKVKAGVDRSKMLPEELELLNF